jgi:membrane protease YdiL (CAAX protease family)
LQSLMFLLPMLVLYEAGTLAYRANVGELPAIKAQAWVTWAFGLFGVDASVGGVWALLLPPVLIVVLLASMHAAERGRARVRPRLWPGMWAESIVLAAPLLVFSAVMFRRPSGEPGVVLQAVGPGDEQGWLGELLLSLGAGLYEELVFRLIAIASVHALATSVIRMKDPAAAAVAIVVSAVLFALYHFDQGTAFHAGLFVFYFVAGVYLAGVYLLRGFGIAVACHAVYDVAVVTLKVWQGG